MDLVQRLSTGRHPVEVALRPDRTAVAFKAALDRGYVHIRFTDTKGGTELGVKLDSAYTNVAAADFDGEIGSVSVGGELTLDYVRVRCLAIIDLQTLRGEGWLEQLDVAV